MLGAFRYSEAMNEEIRNQRRSKTSSGVLLILIPILLAGGVIAQQMSLSSLRKIRILERLPLTPVESAIPGPIRTNGKAEEIQRPGRSGTIKALWTKTPSLWVRAVEEKETRDSEGNTSWVTVLDTTSFVKFELANGPSRILLVPDQAIDPYLKRSWRKTSGKRRYSEYRIEPGDAIKVVGLVSEYLGTPAITFDEEGEYLPILSDRPISEIRSGKGILASVLVTLSLLAISGGCVAFMLFFRFQNALTFVAVIGILESSFLLVGSTLMLASDLQASHRSLTDSVESAEKIVQQGFEKIGVPWNGSWTDDAAFSMAASAQAPGPRLVMIRDSLASRCARSEEIRDRFPQWLVAKGLGLGSTPRIVDSTGEKAELQAIPQARPFWLWPTLAIAIGGLLGLIGIRWGMKGIKVKRLIENIPSTPCGDVEIGITEVIGRVGYATSGDTPSLEGPLTGNDCVWFEYHVQEWRGSGKNRHLHTIEKRSESTDFLCIDDSGSIPVLADGAGIISGRSAKKKKGRRIYTEQSLREGDPLYVLGSGEIDPSTGDSLRLEKDPQDLPFIISNLPESRIKTMKITVAFWMIAIGIAAVSSAFLFILSFTGTVSAFQQLMAALASIGTVAMLILVLLYNDLVFLRQRTYLAKSNIEVALKKRFDLLPRLEDITRGYADHESRTQEMVTELRRDFERERGESPDEAESGSIRTIRKMLAIREEYPDLKANTVFQKLMSAIVSLENEISARRKGYNAAAERYMARLHSIPEIVLARLFRFQGAPLLEWKSEMVNLADFDLTPPAEEGSKDERPTDESESTEGPAETDHS